VRVSDLGFRVQSSRSGLRFGVQGSERTVRFQIWGSVLTFSTKGVGFRVYDLRYRVPLLH
jgi:hypothetical protein